MSEFNPYAPPVASVEAFGTTSQGDWQLQGDTLVVQKGALLPRICLYDGTTVNGASIQRNMAWVPVWVRILVVLSPLIFLIVFFIVRKQGTVGYYLGDAAKKRRTEGVLLIVGSIVVLVGCMIASAGANEPILMLVGLLGFLVMLIFGAMRVRSFTLTKIDDQFVYLKLPPAAVQAFAQQR